MWQGLCHRREIHGTRIRSHGIDAPELAQICTTTEGVPWGCGIAARVELRELIAGRLVTCFGKADQPDKYGRLIAMCRTREII